MKDDPFQNWLGALEERHLERLTFAEVRRALQALSSLYVQRRERLPRCHGLDTAGKRAAFGLFYGPLHYLQVREILRAIAPVEKGWQTLIDLGCGTGAAGAAWALRSNSKLTIRGFDQSNWAVNEANWSYSVLGISGSATRRDIVRVRMTEPGSAILIAFTANELSEDSRRTLLSKLLPAANKGNALLVVEPISRRVTPWMKDWAAAFSHLGGLLQDWRFQVSLPERLSLLDKAAGLNHRRELTCRSLRVNL